MPIFPLVLKIKATSQEARASISFAVASLLSQGMAFISMPIFTRVMSVEQMGEVVTYTTWLGLIGSITGLGLSSGSFSIAMMKFDTRRDGYLLATILLSFMSSSVFLAVVVIMHQSIAEMLAISEPLVYLMAGMLLLNPIVNLWLLRQRYEYRYKSTLLVVATNAVVGTMLAVALVLLAKSAQFDMLPEVRLYSSSCITAIVCLVLVVSVVRKGHPLRRSECFTYWKFAIVSSLPLMIHSLGKYVLDASDRVMIGVYLNMGAVGFYSILYSISAISLVLWNAINSSFIPYMFERLKINDASNIARVATSLLGVYTVACICLMLLAPEMVSLLATEEYSHLIYLMPPIAAGVFFTALYNLYSNLVLFREKTYLIMLATLVAAATNVALNAFAIPRYGLVAAAYTTLISYVLLAMMQFLFAKTLRMSHVYNNRANLVLALIVVLASLLVNLLYSYTFARLGVLALLLIGLAIARNRVMNVFSSIKGG